MKSLLSLAICLIYLLGLSTISIAQCPRETISRDNIQNLEAITYFSIDDAKEIGAVRWSNDGEILYVVTQGELGKYNEIRAFKTDDFTLPPEIIVLEENIRHLWILNTGEIVLATNQEDLDLELHQQSIRTVPASADALASSGDFYIRTTDDNVQVIEYSTHNLISEFASEIDPTCDFSCGITSVAISPDDNHIAYASFAGSASSAIINLETKTVFYDSYIRSDDVIFSPDGNLIVSTAGSPGYTSTYGIFLADGHNGEQIAFVDTYLSGVSNIVFSTDSSLLITGAIDSEYPMSNLTVWVVEELVQVGEGNNDTAISQHPLPFGQEGVYIGTITINPAGTLLITTTYSHDITNMRPEVALLPPFIIVWGIPESENCND